MIFGFAKDYTKIILNVEHELILTRSIEDVDAIRSTTNVSKTFKIELKKIEWIMPYVHLSYKHEIHLLKLIEKNKPIAVLFRCWDLYDNPFLPLTKQHVWSVKISG